MFEQLFLFLFIIFLLFCLGLVPRHTATLSIQYWSNPPLVCPAAIRKFHLRILIVVCIESVAVWQDTKRLATLQHFHASRDFNLLLPMTAIALSMAASDYNRDEIAIYKESVSVWRGAETHRIIAKSENLIILLDKMKSCRISLGMPELCMTRWPQLSNSRTI